MASDVAYKPLEKTKTIYDGGTLTPPKYMPSFYEWLRGLGTQIIEDTSTGGVSTLYQVPEGQALFINSVHCEVTEDGTGGAGTTYVSGVKVFNPDTLLISSSTGGGTKNSISSIKTFTIPLMFSNQEIIQVIHQTKHDGHSGFEGFLVPKNVIPAF